MASKSLLCISNRWNAANLVGDQIAFDRSHALGSPGTGAAFNWCGPTVGSQFTEAASTTFSDFSVSHPLAGRRGAACYCVYRDRAKQDSEFFAGMQMVTRLQLPTRVQSMRNDCLSLLFGFYVLRPIIVFLAISSLLANDLCLSCMCSMSSRCALCLLAKQILPIRTRTTVRRRCSTSQARQRNSTLLRSAQSGTKHYTTNHACQSIPVCLSTATCCRGKLLLIALYWAHEDYHLPVCSRKYLPVLSFHNHDYYRILYSFGGTPLSLYRRKHDHDCLHWCLPV